MAAERAEVDTRSPFSSVKEAVAVFGDRLLAAGNRSLHTVPKPEAKPPPPPRPPPLQASSASSSPLSFSSSTSHLAHDELATLASLKRLEADMRQTRRELLALKESEAETEAAVAALGTELSRSVPELTAAADINEDGASRVRSERWHEEKAEDELGGGGLVEYLPTLAQAFRFGELDDDFGYMRRRRRQMMDKRNRRRRKKKPIIPLIWDIFPKKKGSNYYLDSFSLYSRSFYSDLG